MVWTLAMKLLWRLLAILPLFAPTLGHALVRREMMPNPAFVAGTNVPNLAKLPSLRRLDSSKRGVITKGRQHVVDQQAKLDKLGHRNDPALRAMRTKMQENTDFINRLLAQDPKKPGNVKGAAKARLAKETPSEDKEAGAAARQPHAQTHNRVKESAATGAAPGGAAPQPVAKPARQPNNALLSDWSDWNVGAGGNLKYGGH